MRVCLNEVHVILGVGYLYTCALYLECMICYVLTIEMEHGGLDAFL